TSTRRPESLVPLEPVREIRRTDPANHFRPSTTPRYAFNDCRRVEMGARLILVLLLTLTPALWSTRARAQTFMVRDVRVFDGERVAERRSVLVQDGVIARVGGSDLAVPPGTDVIDGRGRTLLPGLIDAHIHLSDGIEEDLRQAASLGVTTVLDMWNS